MEIVKILTNYINKKMCPTATPNEAAAGRWRVEIAGKTRYLF